jgi:hypothetical protein
LIEQNQAEMVLDSGYIPVASVEARSPDSGNFDWKDYYRSILKALEDPFADYKITTGSRRVYGSGQAQIISKVKPTLADLRNDVEHNIKLRKLIIFLVDEAQRFAKLPSARRREDQMDAIQSMASFSATRYGLLGTYELLQLRNLSGQLSRRSIDIHFPRYQVENSEDIKDFKRVLKSFSTAIPLLETPDLEKDWEFFYERSIGCVGIVKDWLTQALRKALSESSNTLKKSYLDSYAVSAAKCRRMLSEANQGEKTLKTDEQDLKALRQELGIKNNQSSKNSSKPQANNNQVKSASKKRRPGERNPSRDIVGDV